MSEGHVGIAIVLGVVLTLVVVGGNFVFAAHASVLDPGFVTDSLEEEDGYEALTEEMQRSVENAMADADGGIEGTAFGSIVDGNPVEDAVTPDYVQSQVDPNVVAIYAYLHGDSATLDLTLDTRPLAEAAGKNVAASVRNASITELMNAAPGDPLADVPVNASFVAELNEGPSAYETAKADLRDRIYEEVLEAAVDDAFARASNDELLALVIPDYDPDDYSESEKEQMVADREDEIRTALAERIERDRGDELDATVQDRLDTYRQDATGSEPDPERVGNQAIADAAGDLQSAVVVATTTDQSYEDYRASVTGARADLATAVGDYVTQRFDSEAGVVDLNEELNIPERGEFGTARTVVGAMDLLAIALPILALLLIGGVWLATRSPMVTAATVGASLFVGALVGFVGGSIAGGQLRSMIDLQGESAATLEPVVQGLVDRTVGTITGQSLLVAVLGILVLGLAVALYYGLDDRIAEAVRNE